MKVLVTGATGFIGRSVVPLLRRAGHEVYGTSRSVQDEGSTQVTRWDLANEELGDNLPNRVDAIIHLAADSGKHGRETVLREVNVEGTRRLIAYARIAGCRRFVMASTAGVCGYHEGSIDEATEPAPVDEYARSKLEAELLLSLEQSLHWTVLRLAPTYGAGQLLPRLVPRLLRCVLRGDPIDLHPGSRPRMNILYVEDAAAALAAAAGASKGGFFFCGGPDTANVKEIAEIIGGSLGREPNFRLDHLELGGDLVVDFAKASRELGWTPGVSLVEGLRLTLAQKGWVDSLR